MKQYAFCLICAAKLRKSFVPKRTILFFLLFKHEKYHFCCFLGHCMRKCSIEMSFCVESAYKYSKARPKSSVDKKGKECIRTRSGVQRKKFFLGSKIVCPARRKNLRRAGQGLVAGGAKSCGGRRKTCLLTGVCVRF